jgi:hypothetical protein
VCTSGVLSAQLIHSWIHLFFDAFSQEQFIEHQLCASLGDRHNALPSHLELVFGGCVALGGNESHRGAAVISCKEHRKQEHTAV